MKKTKVIIIALLLIIIAVVGCVLGYQYMNKEKDTEDVATEKKEEKQEEKKETKKMSEYQIDEGLSNFDLSFLKMENQKENLVYSPLSIKYALGMLEEAAEGDAKEEISNILSSYKVKDYTNSKNMSFGNALFVRDTFDVKKEYKSLLQEKYNADVITDSFESADTINSWISDKTLKLIENLVTDDDVKSLNFALVNALGIDMEWRTKFLSNDRDYDKDKNLKLDCDYEHINNTWWQTPAEVRSHEFENINDKVSGMEIYATLNNYDIMNELGEDKIRETVTEEFMKWAKNEGKEYTDTFNGDYSDENIKKVAKEYLEGTDNNDSWLTQDGYLKELDSNYKDVSYSTDFSLYVDDEVKMFAKDLKEYDGTTLEYIAIMPTEEELDKFIEDINVEEIKDLIGNLKELKSENFNDGVITEITGYIPKFKFDYDLDLMEDLNKMGIAAVFEQGKAELTNLTEDEDTYISDAKHKANIEFTQDGIKASAVTMAGGMGAGEFFDYVFEVPIEKIDLTFDKPYMFLIRDKETGEVWFAGNVYEPLLWEDDQTVPDYLRVEY
ncbi:MAG: serpin family protein [Clostridia bacterium]|jgi:serine protease inhibitor|nr:serpin family protein [Clostridia bacterium]